MSARHLIETYHRDWTCGDFDSARRWLAEDLDFKGSIDAFDRADDFVGALKGFQRMLRGVTLLRGLFEEDGAALLSDCDTATPAGVIRTAEFFATKHGRIAEIRLIFDATALRRLMQR